jgi:hypothetical protein
MPNRSHAILFIGLISGLAGLFIFLSRVDPTEEHGLSRKEGDPSSGHPTAAAGLTDEALPSKSNPRSPPPKISKARTLALLETPIAGPVEFPAQALPERVETLNRILAAAGISADEARIEVHPSFAVGMQFVCPELILTDSTPKQMLQYITGSTRMCFHAEAGVVYFYDCAKTPFGASPVTPK